MEGMPPEVLVQALERAGATFEDGGGAAAGAAITKGDLYELGFSGGPDSGVRRAALLKKLGLPERMTANALLEALNILYSREEFLEKAALSSRTEIG